jgi:hypothetical protein
MDRRKSADLPELIRKQQETNDCRQGLALFGECPFHGSPEALYIFPYAANRGTSF